MPDGSTIQRMFAEVAPGYQPYEQGQPKEGQPPTQPHYKAYCEQTKEEGTADFQLLISLPDRLPDEKQTEVRQH